MRRKIIVVGDILLDKTTVVHPVKISPEDPSVLVVRAINSHYNLGGAGNVARNCVTLNNKHRFGDVRLFGFTLDGYIIQLSSQADIALVFNNPMTGQKTPIKERFITKDGHYLLRVDIEDSQCGRDDHYWRSDPRSLVREVAVLLKMVPHPSQTGGNGEAERFPVFCFVDHGKGCLTHAAVTSFMDYINSYHETCKFPILVDPGKSDWEWYSSPRTIFKVNFRQCLAFHRHLRATRFNFDRLIDIDADEFDEMPATDRLACMGLLNRMKENLTALKIEFAGMVITLGAAGLVVGSNKPGETGHWPSPETVLRPDVCGAGDTVLATVADYLARQDDATVMEFGVLNTSGRYAVRAATIAVKHSGVHAVTSDELDNSLG